MRSPHHPLFTQRQLNVDELLNRPNEQKHREDKEIPQAGSQDAQTD